MNANALRSGLKYVYCLTNVYVIFSGVLRVGERGTCIGPPFLGSPSTCFARKFSPFLVRNLSAHTGADLGGGAIGAIAPP